MEGDGGAIKKFKTATTGSVMTSVGDSQFYSKVDDHEIATVHNALNSFKNKEKVVVRIKVRIPVAIAVTVWNLETSLHPRHLPLSSPQHAL